MLALCIHARKPLTRGGNGTCRHQASPRDDTPQDDERLADRVEPSLAGAGVSDRYQFLRHGYFCLDAVDSTPQRPVFNRTVALRDTWAKLRNKN